MEVQIWLSEQDEVVVNPGDLTLMTEQGAVVFMGDAEERMAWLKKVAEAMECEVKPFTPEYHNAVDTMGDMVDEALFKILRDDQTIHWMGKPSD